MKTVLFYVLFVLIAVSVKLLVAVDLPEEEKKPGWMDEVELTDKDRSRLKEIPRPGCDVQTSGEVGDGTEIAVIRAIQGGKWEGISRRDFELLRQDRRRAIAAYPDIAEEELFQPVWLNIGLKEKVPSSYCGGNSHGTKVDGHWYLDGPCYSSVVKSKYPNRADTKATEEFFVARKQKERERRIAFLKEHGPMALSSGSGGSFSIRSDKDTNMVTVEKAEEWASVGKQWAFPFVLEEWVDLDYYSIETVSKLPSFAQAQEKEITVEPSGVTITFEEQDR